VSQRIIEKKGGNPSFPKRRLTVSAQSLITTLDVEEASISKRRRQLKNQVVSPNTEENDIP